MSKSFLPGHCWSLHSWICVKSSLEDSQPVKHDLDLFISPPPQDVEQVDQSPHDDSCIPFRNIIRVVRNGIFDVSYNLLHCKCLFESDHWQKQENIFHQCKFYFWSFLHFHRMYCTQNKIPMSSILNVFHFFRIIIFLNYLVVSRYNSEMIIRRL